MYKGLSIIINAWNKKYKHFTDFFYKIQFVTIDKFLLTFFIQFQKSPVVNRTFLQPDSLDIDINIVDKHPRKLFDVVLDRFFQGLGHGFY